MKTDHGLKMQALKFSCILIVFLTFFAEAKTLKVDTITPSVTNGDLTLSKNGTGDIVIDSLSGVLRGSSGVVTAGNVNMSTEVTGVLPVANGGTGSATQNFVDLSAAQSVSGVKTFVDSLIFSSEPTFEDPLVFDHQTTPSNPSSGSIKVYAKNDDKLYKLDSLGNEIEIGSGSKVLSLSVESSSATLSISDDFIYCDTSVGNVTLTLPSSGSNIGKVYRIEKTHASNECIIDADGSDTIEGESTLTLYSKDDYVEITSGVLGVWDISIYGIKVFARYTSNSGQAISTGGTDLIFEDIEHDSHAAYNVANGDYTIPISGFYCINVTIGYQTNPAAGELMNLAIRLNGSDIAYDVIEQNPAAGSTTGYQLKANYCGSLSTGGVVDFVADQTVTGSISVTIAPERVNFSIVRIK